MASLVKNLAYEDSSNGFKWIGTKTELKTFVNFALAVEEDQQDGEWTEDKSHSAFTFKQQGCFARFYSTTKKLVIQGPSHARCDKYHLCPLFDSWVAFNVHVSVWVQYREPEHPDAFCTCICMSTVQRA